VGNDERGLPRPVVQAGFTRQAGSDGSDIGAYEVQGQLPAPVTITLTSPADGSTYGAPASLSLSASPSSTCYAISYVNFYTNGTLAATVTASPYTYSWTGVAAGTYSVYAQAVYAGGSVYSLTNHVTVTNPPPTITLVTPADGSAYLAPASVALASTVVGNGNTISYVSFYTNGTVAGSVAAAPYNYSWTGVPAGSYSVYAQVVYAGGYVYSLTNHVTVTNPPPTITLVTPADGSAYLAPASLTLGSTVVGNGNTISSVNFYTNGTMAAMVTAAPYSYSWTGVPAGSYSIYAQAVYTGGAVYSLTNHITVTNPPPTITLVAPADGSAYLAPATVTLGSTVVGNGNTISSVNFYTNGTMAASVTAGPYSYSWTGVPAGTYSIYAQAVYAGSTVTSLTNHITVTNPPPTITLVTPADGSAYLAPATVTLGSTVVGNGNTISSVNFYTNGTMAAMVTAAPYNYNWTGVPAGSYSIYAQAVYAGSTVISLTNHITVTNPPPTITLVTPADGSAYPAPANLTLASTVVSNGNPISSVSFYTNGVVAATVTVSPYNYSWTGVPAGSYSIYAQAVYAGGTAASLTNHITVTNPPPTITLVTPADGSAYLAPASLTLASTVAANGNTISSVNFCTNGTMAAMVTVAPYSYSWTGVPAGSYSIYAQAVYAGSTVTSLTNHITVTNSVTRPMLVGLSLGTLGFSFSFTDVPSTSFTVYASSNLTKPFSSWTSLGHPLEVNKGPFSLYQFTDPQATNPTNRALFYRVKNP
jgi:sulfur relay (sulfurtransferase) complex TusBCD TusD component (DsrE family)